MLILRVCIVYNFCMLRRKKKGFTLVELVTAIAILGVATAMTTAVIVNFNQIQNASSDQYRYDEELRNINKCFEDYVNFISLNNSEVSFNYVSNTDTSLTFSYDTYSYVVSYADKKLKVTNDYDGEVNYFKFNRSIDLNYTSAFKLSYYSDLALLNLKVTINNKEHHMDYVVRTLL